MTNRTVAAVFDRYDDAARAVSKLEAAGVAHSDISIVSNDATQRDRYSGTTTGTSRDHDKTGTGAATGASTGAALGAGAGLLAGLGLLAIPGLGPVVAAGWLASTLVGAGAGAATGGLLGSLAGAGIDEADAHSYAEAVHRGGTLVTVRATAANHDRVVDILDDDGTVDMSQRETAWRSEGWTGQYTGGSGTAGGAVSDAASSVGRAASRAADKVSDAASSAGSAMGLNDGRDARGTATGRSDPASSRTRVRSYPL
jgi:uncharacterized membrane protein